MRSVGRQAARSSGRLSWAVALAVLAVPARALKIVTLDSKAPLLEIKVMVKAGSAQDPEGLEGLAALTAKTLLEGGYGDPADPVTKERLAEMTRPWGAGAMPRASVSKETTVISFAVPREVYGEYLERVLAPLLARPLFAEKELERLRAESLQALRSSLRLEQIEALGLVGLDNYIHEGTSYAHPRGGTEKGLQAVSREALLRFYRTYYRAEGLVAGVSAGEKGVSDRLSAALAGMGNSGLGAGLKPLPTRAASAPPAVSGRRVLVVALPNAASSGIHAGFPLPLTRRDKDYWPLYVANVWFGTHRDFSYLFKRIREERGYNYGDYSYIEHFEERPYHLFPPLNHPRRHQCFSLWVRPVAHAYVPHLVKAITWELENFVRRGLTKEQCAQAKNKARVLYLNLAETAERILASRLDDAFYGLEPGYFPEYLSQVEAVTCEGMNAAVRQYLQPWSLKYLVVTHAEEAPKIAEALAAGGPVWGKAPADYQIDVKEEGGQKLYLVPEPKLELLRRDAVWAHYPLEISRQDIWIVPAEKMFETADLPKP